MEFFNKTSLSSAAETPARRRSGLMTPNLHRTSISMKDSSKSTRYLSPRNCWLATTKLEKCTILLVLCLFFLGLYYACSTLNAWKSSNLNLDSKDDDLENSRKSQEIFNNLNVEPMFPNIDIDRAPISFNCDREIYDFKREINELLRIKKSVLNELRLLEEKRNVIRTEITILLTQSEKLQSELQQGVKDLEKISASIEQAKTAHRETVERNMPEIYLPRKLDQLPVGLSSDDYSRDRGSACSMDSCFDFSRCSYVTGFSSSHVGLRPNLHNVLHIYEWSSERSVCLVLINASAVSEKKFHSTTTNRVVLLGEQSDIEFSFLNSDIRVGSTFKRRDFRPDFDMVIPPLINAPYANFWKYLPPLVPARRRYLMSFLGISPVEEDLTVNPNFVTKFLQLLQNTKTTDRFKIDVTCSSFGEGRMISSQEWSLCSNETSRNQISRQSTFSLVLVPSSFISTTHIQIRLLEAIKYGSIPVIVGSTYLPFGEVLDWRKCAVMLPASRITELQYVLRSFQDSDILELRRNGRLFYEKYFLDDVTVVRTLLGVLRHRLMLPASPLVESESKLYFNETFQPTVTEVTQQTLLESDEYIGPVESSLGSAKFQRNFSGLTVTAYESWNIYTSALAMHEFDPFLTPMPSEAKFDGSQFGFRPVNNGVGGSGKEFSESLGGNFPREQFTVILLTYEREQVLLAALARLHHLPYLNKIIVVWNGPTAPATDSFWPKLSVPVVVIKMDKNSLNNRFLPFAEIETESVLSMDDDVHLRHDEIIFGFRVWREARNRVVGFPGRFHGWDSQSHRWNYNSNHSCELSMVLTGAAFLHKYYLHLYSNEMSPAVRTKVDDLMNCEDIAMNFLISHVTRKPPIKVTSRWTFRCPGCPEALSADDSHFNERHECINYFTKVYGYNPLLYTQFRVDSVLFKTKIPQNHQKCFKFI